jgi:hypothetical protein
MRVAWLTVGMGSAAATDVGRETVVRSGEAADAVGWTAGHPPTSSPGAAP